MFPNFRLLIAAACASIMVLSFGFGLFAVLRVSHEPLGRVSEGTAALQLVADKAAPVVAALAAGEASIRIEAGPPQAADVTASLPTANPKQRDNVEVTAAVAAPEPDVAAAPEQAVPVTSIPESQPDAADSQPVSPVAAISEPERDAKLEEATAGNESPAVATGIAAAETSAEQAPPSDPPRQSEDEQPASPQPAVEAMEESVPDVPIAATEAPLLEEVPLPPKRPTRKVASHRASPRVRRIARAPTAPATNSSIQNANAPSAVTVQSLNNWPLNAQTAQAAPQQPAPKRVRLAKHRPAASSAVGGPLVRLPGQ